MQTKAIQLMGYRKDKVVMLYGQGTSRKIIDPEGLFSSLTFGTVPVATTVVTVAYGTALLASLLMSAKGSRAATAYLTQYP